MNGKNNDVVTTKGMNGVRKIPKITVRSRILFNFEPPTVVTKINVAEIKSKNEPHQNWSK